MNKKTLILVFVVALIVFGIYYLEQTKTGISNVDSISIAAGGAAGILKEGKYEKAPELTGIAGYLNSEEGITIKKFTEEGKVVLIDFWTYTCINCIRTFPYLTSWDEKYRDEGLVIIGVHTPEFEFEKKYENVQDAIEKYDIKYPVVQDNDYATWTAFRNSYWPRKYLIDTEGYIRYDHIGEGAYEVTEEKIKELLAEIGSDVENIEVTAEEGGLGIRLLPTPELYAGYSFALNRGQNLGNSEGMQPGKTITYTLPSEISSDTIYLEGLWKSNPDNLELIGNIGFVVLNFKGKEVNIVADSLEDPLMMEVLIDGNYITNEQAGSDVVFEGEKSFILVDSPQLYNVIEGQYGNHVLTLKAEKGFIFNAFTFG